METEELIARIQQNIAEVEHVLVEGADCNFSVTVISAGFTDLNIMQRQKKVMALFSQELQTGALHALTVKAHTPAEWQLKRQEGLMQISLG